MLDLIFAHGADPAAEDDLLDRLREHQRAVTTTESQFDRQVVRLIEAAVERDPAGTISFDGRNRATLRAEGHAWDAGRFEVPMLWSLKKRARECSPEVPGAGERYRLWVIDGEGAATDIGALQATAPAGTLFQAASQFNCLESPGPRVTPINRYFSDPTQGPRASISAFPGTFVRHYAAPASDGRRFTQTTDGDQIDLLADVCHESIARVDNGYLRTECIYDPEALLQALTERFDAVRVGVHDEVQVALGYNWTGSVEGERRIAQVFTSTLAGGGYSDRSVKHEPYLSICRQLLRAAYLGTLLAARSLGKRAVVLTLIGGGVFSNPVRLIWESILWALDAAWEVAPGALEVVVNGRAISQQIARDELADEARARGGILLEMSRHGVSLRR